MKSRIEVTKTDRRGDKITHPGVYRVPEDMSRAEADRLIAAGNAVALDTVRKEAPQNKSFRSAPENKVAAAEPAGGSGGDRPVAAKPRRANKKRK